MAEPHAGEVVLTDPQRRALRVLVAAIRRSEPRPVRASNRTTLAAAIPNREMLTVHHKVARQLIDADLVRWVNPWIGTLELTDVGHEVAREAGL